MNVNLNLLSTLSIAIVFFIIGTFLKDKIKFFSKFCIPSPVIGGLLFTLLSLFLRIFNIVNISVSQNFISIFMTAFFTILGLNASFKLVKKGGSLLFKYWILCGFLALSQNIIAVSIAKITNIHPLIALMCGTISMEGGHGNAAAFGSTIEKLGINGAVTIGLASATLGIIIGGLLGAPVARYLIEKNNLKPKFNPYPKLYNKKCNFLTKSFLTRNSKPNIFTPINFFEHTLVILLCLNFGDLIARTIYLKTSIVIPSVVGCMIVACIFRNFNDKAKLIDLNFYILDFASDISLSMFLIIALMSINLLDLSTIAGPMILIIFAQVIFILIYSIFVCFKVLGKNFDAAVMVSGIIGHGIGNTPNALANINSVTHKYGPSEKASLIVPLVGAFLLDTFSLPCIIIFINLFK